MPADLRPKVQATTPGTTDKVMVDYSLVGLVTNWRLVVAELMERGVDLHHRDVLAGPWVGIRTLIFSLIDSDTRLRRALIRR